MENENNLTIPKLPAEAANLLDAVVRQMLTDLWKEIEEKRNLVIEKLNLDDDGNEKPSSEVEEGEEIPEGFIGNIYRNQLILLANEYSIIMDEINDIIVVAGSKHSA
jgi:hypothetical protein